MVPALMHPSQPGWPVVLADGPVVLRPYRRSDAYAWSQVRLANEDWLAPWEPTPLGTWEEANSLEAYRLFHREQRRAVRQGTAMPFAITLRTGGDSGDGHGHGPGGGPGGGLGSGAGGGAGGAYAPAAERYVGHISLANIVRRALASGNVGYWIDARVAGRGIVPTALALVVDHAFGGAGLHRVEVDIRPENRASRRVVEKLGFREEAYHLRYMFIDGAWRDHIGYALTSEDVAADGGLLTRWRRLRGDPRGPA